MAGGNSLGVTGKFHLCVQVGHKTSYLCAFIEWQGTQSLPVLLQPPWRQHLLLTQIVKTVVLLVLYWIKIKVQLKFIVSFEVQTVMATVFWNSKVLLINYLPRGTTITVAHYFEVKTQLRRAIQNKWRESWQKTVFIPQKCSSKGSSSDPRPA